MSQRGPQIVLVASVLVLSWLGMMAVHELGHVVGAWWTGGRIARVIVHPLAISRTDLAVNPRPLLAAWSGPVVGVVLPLFAWGVARLLQWSEAYLLRFFAGFCLVANGAYIGGGSFARVGDCGDLLRHGAAVWQLWLFGLASAALGLWLWHGLGPKFGFGEVNGRVSRRAATAWAAAALTALGACVVLSPTE